MNSSPFPKAPVGLEFSASDHVSRAEFFLANANATDDLNIFNWLLMASIYSARAPIEIALTDWDSVYKRGDTAPFLKEAEKNIRRFKLISTIRVHDFHRGAIHLQPNSQTLFGPIALRTGSQPNSSVGLTTDPQTGKLVEHKVRNAHISYDRPVQSKGFEVFDFATDEFVFLPLAIREYLDDLKVFLQIQFPKIEWN